MSKIKVNSISDRLDEGAPELTYGATIPSGGVVSAQGNVSLTGIATVSEVSSASLTATTVNATSFSGDGSSLTGLPTVNSGKVIALKLIFDPIPFRS
jgi:hypothetical protein